MSTLALQQRVITGDRPGPHLLITGGVHGDEFEPMAAVRRLIREFKPAQLRGKLTLVPIVNEAAFWRGHRTADDGLDLARTCPGKTDGSITERTAHALSELIGTADAYIDLHTGGTTMALWPLTGYALVSDAKVLDTQRRMARAFNLPFIWGTSSKLNGRSLSVARDAKVPAIYAEWGGAATSLPEAVEGYTQGCLNVMTMLGMIDAKPAPRRGGNKKRPGQPPLQKKYLVEDDRDQSGHLQLMNPSPMAGYFEPTVKLGEIVKKRQVFGTVSDALGGKVVEVTSPVAGVVILLRTFPMVKEKETLAAIVELDKAEVLP